MQFSRLLDDLLAKTWNPTDQLQVVFFLFILFVKKKCRQKNFSELGGTLLLLITLHHHINSEIFAIITYMSHSLTL